MWPTACDAVYPAGVRRDTSEHRGKILGAVAETGHPNQLVYPPSCRAY